MPNIDIFERRTMLEPVIQNFEPRRFLLRTFFPGISTFNTEKVDLDFVRGGRTMAPFVGKGYGSKTVERHGFETKTLRPPLVAPDLVTTAEHLLNRLPGENIYNSKSPQERAVEQLGKDLVELDDMVNRREEWMCSQVLFSGMVEIVGTGVEETVYFWPDNDADKPYLELTGDDLWTSAASDPLVNVRNWKRKVSLTSGFTPRVAVMGAKVVDAFVANEAISKYLDNRRKELGKIEPKDLEEGVTFYGTIEGVDFYGYDELVYNDVSGKTEPLVPEDKILLGAPGRGEMLYGAVVLADEAEKSFTLVESPRVPDTWVSRKPEGRFVAMKSAPLPNPGVADAYLVAKVV
ncbi:major capsid protein [Salmonella enterica]|uniref:Major capsid protein n=3 Tax=Salmonella enterica TaxID=28901 RepID=A0A5U9NYA2_SALMU|nr:major capsid protein [Salmonella enterica]AZS99907.1 major capsid protein [Salmonella enterica subsp. enterica serovar Mikawasima]EAA1528740.1 major capsid protein [Salmonella enterica subsp. enterica serovar Tennessee]EAA4514299.1 major capsid protein [Salmonella enterica subsp. enterica serovar Vitkin]EAA7336487.1 major capsid protein [Salmonella enterica subsp. enterica]EBF6938733.1 major capsid protein [Salmonella enterica subsp. enterica serovar Concord]EBH0962447.1 major capsid prote